MLAGGKRQMTEPNDKPTAEEIARAKEILRREGEKPCAQQSGFMGVWGMILQMTHTLPKAVIVGALVVFLGYHAWDYYNAARRDPAETQDIMAKAGTAQVDYEAQNKMVGNDTRRGAMVEAELRKLRAEAITAEAQAEANSMLVDPDTNEPIADADGHVMTTHSNPIVNKPAPAPAPRQVQQAARETPPPAPRPASTPSALDCVNGRHSGIDFEICAYPELLAAEARLNDAYHAARATGGDEVKIAQRTWSKSFGPGCGLPPKGQPSAAQMAQSRACVLNAINQRINDLNKGV
jgi:uncharacterized protein YecT (DUF1311 family)